jgi:ribosomal protein S12 methylthiotransferase
MFFSFINLWCNKNLVDTQYLLWKILEKYWKDFEYVTDPFSEDTEIVFLNTCSFISSWREEMFETINELQKYNKKICLIWCWVQYFEHLTKKNNISDDETKKREELKNNNNIYTLSWEQIANFSLDMLTKKESNYHCDYTRPQSARAYTNIDKWYEYIKIAEWCNNHCSFCIIPQIRGPQKSLPKEVIIQEAKNLINQWVKEIILLAQDTTRYGIDLYWEAKLFELLEEIDKLEWDFNYRVLYLYPDILTKKHLEKLVKLKKFIPYFDLPLQHSSPTLLKSMWRFYDHEMTLKLLDFIKNNFKEYFIRTNFIIGFPWETDEDFENLISFIKEDHFNNIALFEYHDEKLAESTKLPNKIDDKTIRERFLKAEQLVNELLKKRERNRRNKEFTWIVSDIYSKDDKFEITIRPSINCPEIDNEDCIRLENIIECLDWEEIDIGSRLRYINS